MSAEYDKYQHKRDVLQQEVMASVIKPISFEVFKKTEDEKVALKNAKCHYIFQGVVHQSRLK